MAVGKSSRPKKEFNKMLVGLENITEKTSDEKIISKTDSVEEVNPVEVINPKTINSMNTPKPALDIDAIQLVQVVDKSKMGRPKVLTGEYKPISTRLKLENLEYAKKISGIYGGLTGYLNWLIEEDKKRRFGN